MKQPYTTFHETTSGSLARQIDPRATLDTAASLSDYYASYTSRDIAIVVVPPVEAMSGTKHNLSTGKRNVHQALASVLHHKQKFGERPIALLLPKGYSEAAATRLPWLEFELELYEHSGETVKRVAKRTRGSVLASYRDEFRHGEHELKFSSPRLQQLINWADGQGLSDAHRISYLAWHYRGRQVLSIRGTAKSVTIEAGIQHSTPKAEQTKGFSETYKELTTDDIAAIKKAVATGIADRVLGLDPPANEHWFQSVLRGEPELLELRSTPLLREFPVSRPSGEEMGEGYIDLLGVDLAGRIQIIETKLGSDNMLALQGLDYWIWVQAHADDLRRHVLELSPTSPIELHLVVDMRSGKPFVNGYCKSHLQLLSPDIPWRITGIEDWQNRPTPVSCAIGELP